MSDGAIRRHVQGVEMASQSGQRHPQIPRISESRLHRRVDLLHQPIPLSRCNVHYLPVQGTSLAQQ